MDWMVLFTPFAFRVRTLLWKEARYTMQSDSGLPYEYERTLTSRTKYTLFYMLSGDKSRSKSRHALRRSLNCTRLALQYL